MSGGRIQQHPEGLESLNQVTEFLDQGVIVLDHSLNIVFWNRWMAGASGHAAADVLGRSFFDVFPDLAGTTRGRALERALAGEVVVFSQRFHQHFIPLPPPAGFTEVGSMQQTARIAPRVKADRIVGVVVLIQDVTERTVREAELREALRAAEQASRAKSEFLSSMSHELRTPLNVVLGYADLLSSEIGGTINRDQRNKVERIKSSVWHLLGIIDEILTFARVEAGKEPIAREDADLVHLVRETASMFEHSAAERSLSLETDLKIDVLPVYTDPRRVRQVLLNLIGNAVKFTERGGVTIRVERDGDRALVKVVDTGPGIDQDRLSDIFEPFTRVEGAPGSPGGTGLGLPLSRRLAKLIGGDVSVESEKGVGSVFTLSLQLD